MHRFTRPLVLAALASGLVGLAVAQPATPAFRIAKSVAGPDGHWDYANWDAAHGRVVIAHGSDVLVIDPSGSGSVRAIGAIAGAHAALAIPGTDRLLVTSGHDNSVRILDAASGSEVSRIAVAADPDSATLSSDGRTAYVMGGDSGTVTIIDVAAAKVTGTIALKPGLEAPVLAGPALLAINNEQAGEIDLADVATEKAAGVIALPGCTGPTGLAYAPAQHLALSACANGVAALVDLANRRMVELLPIGEGPDTVIWQATRHRFLVPCGRSGTLAIIALDGQHAHAETSVTTEPSARTAALDPASGQIYLPAARFQTGTTERRPPIVPGSFHLLVLAPSS